MSTRKRTTMMTAVVAGGVFGMRALRNPQVRSRLRAVVDGIRSAIMPTHEDRFLSKPPPDDEAHASGHRHLDRTHVGGDALGRPRRDGQGVSLPDYPGGHR